MRPKECRNEGNFTHTNTNDKYTVHTTVQQHHYNVKMASFTLTLTLTLCVTLTLTLTLEARGLSLAGQMALRKGQ